MHGQRAVVWGAVAAIAVICRASDILDLHRRLDGTPKVVFAQGEQASTVFQSETATVDFIVVVETQRDVGVVHAEVTTRNADETLPAYIASVHTTYTATMHGLLCSLSPAAVVAVAGLPGVVLVEQDGLVFAQPGVRGPSLVGGRRLDSNDSIISPAASASGSGGVWAASAGSQQNPPWDLDRLDQISLPLDNWYRYDDDGSGVDGEWVLWRAPVLVLFCCLCVSCICVSHACVSRVFACVPRSVHR